MIAKAEWATQLLEPFLPGTLPKAPTHSSLILAKMSQSTPTTTPSKLKLNKPPEFNGSYRDYHSWIQKVKLFLHGLKVNDDEEKILVTLFFMTSSPAFD